MSLYWCIPVILVLCKQGPQNLWLQAAITVSYLSWFCGLMGSSGWLSCSSWCQLWAKVIRGPPGRWLLRWLTHTAGSQGWARPWTEMSQVSSTTFSLWLIWASSEQQLNFERVNSKKMEEKLQLSQGTGSMFRVSITLPSSGQNELHTGPDSRTRVMDSTSQWETW